MSKTDYCHKSEKVNKKNVISHAADTYTNNINIINNIDASPKNGISKKKKSKIFSKISTFCSITGITGIMVLGNCISNLDNIRGTEQVSMDDNNISLVQSEKTYKEYLINNIGMNYLITDFIYADFDFNNTYEMFAIADNELESALYYVDLNGLLKLDEWQYGRKSGTRLKILNLEQQSFVVLTDGARVSGHKGDIWTVYNDTPCQIFSKNVYSVDKNEYNEIIIRETYAKTASGNESSGFGITMKPYYFYFLDGKLFEYGGRVIKHSSEALQPPNEFINFPESAKILEEIDNRGFYVVDYLFRANNTITLNLKIKEPKSLQTKCIWAEEYETYRIIDNSLVLEEKGCGSNYLYPYCFVPELAAY